MKISLSHLASLLLSLALVHSLATAADDPLLNEILQKHLNAMGGLRNWSQVESMRLSGTIERDGQTVDIVIVKKRPDQIRATVTVPIPGKKDAYFQIIRAHDGKTAWTATRLAGAPDITKETLPTEDAKELLADAGVLPPLIKLWREGADLELLNTETIDGIAHFSIRATGEDRPSTYIFYVSARDYLVNRYDSHHPKHGITQTTLASYLKKDDVLIPTHNTTQAAQTGQSVMTTESIQIGVGIYEAYFESGDPTNTAKL